MKCPKCKRPCKENTDGDLRYCQGQDGTCIVCGNPATEYGGDRFSDFCGNICAEKFAREQKKAGCALVN